ncbi:hypothetical protein SP60_06240 [Candidatus Thioglobus autotrophicus]|uniref:Membrane fusion protein biotin-lipoyl like domain-containing protein n=1 Tax=Candidatus Thioglobus autotrophicus TaxID=1705394 RepID=A0A0M5LEP0_9GAMM|nr:hypothetical protein [Candidatus Thioglobus autotrophicus]ALE52836.1 hypothetical protein SP60_06240 [Candidatus Thioglobus autotrophicus]
MKFNSWLALSMLLSGATLALDIYPQVSSTIVEIIPPGKQVSSGDVLVKLDDRQAQLTLQHLKAIGNIKQQAFDDALLVFDQTQELYDRMVASHRDLDIAKMARNAQKRELDAHNVLIKIQMIELEKYQIKSPISGVVKQTPDLRNATNIAIPKVLIVIE